jgi:hypothetical protein
MARSIFDDLMPWAIYGGLGYLLLRRGPSGTSLLDDLTQSIGAGIGSGIRIPLPGASGAGAQAGPGNAPPPFPGVSPGSVGDNQYGSANGSGNTFNINTDESWWQGAVSIDRPTAIQAHVGVGHVGGGGTFACVLWGQDQGVFGFGSSGPVWLAQQNFDTNPDADWTGYGIDFDGVELGAAAGLGHTNVWAAIVGLGGEPYTQANLRRV